MIFLWLCIISSTSIYIIFKLLNKFNANLLPAITINYFVATIFGFIQNSTNTSPIQIITSNWLPIAMLIGALFVLMFFLIGYSSQKAGIGVTSIATRMSMVIPIIVSIFLFNEDISILKLLKLTVAFIAVFMAVYRKTDKSQKFIFYLPILLFVGSGSVDALVKIAQNNFVPENDIALFSASLFSISLILSLLILVIKKQLSELKHLPTIFFGAALGLANYASLYFLINALNKSKIDSSFVFGINNLSVVVLSITIGLIFFNEKISKLNWIGILLSVTSVLFLV